MTSAFDFLRRLREVSEDILDTESLSEHLDDSAAKALIEWGLACARRLVERSLEGKEAGMDLAAQIGAVKQMMRAVDHLVGEWQILDPTERAYWWDKLLTHAGAVYAEGAKKITLERFEGLLRQNATPAALLLALRDMFENVSGFEEVDKDEWQDQSSQTYPFE